MDDGYKGKWRAYIQRQCKIKYFSRNIGIIKQKNWKYELFGHEYMSAKVIIKNEKIIPENQLKKEDITMQY